MQEFKELETPPTYSEVLQVGGKAMHELDYSSRSLASSALLHPARVPDSIRAAALRAAYDSPGVTLPLEVMRRSTRRMWVRSRW